MSESRATPEPVPPKSSARLAEIRRMRKRARGGDFSGLISWERVSNELCLLAGVWRKP